jgi:hypothetical protein
VAAVQDLISRLDKISYWGKALAENGKIEKRVFY